MFNQIEHIKKTINELENKLISKNQYRIQLPYCIQINNNKALFYNRDYEIITDDTFDIRQRNKLKDEYYYKNSNNFDFAFVVKTNEFSYIFYNDVSSILKGKNIPKYIENLRFIIKLLENKEILPENDKAFYTL